jgi:hypothetical protein
MPDPDGRKERIYLTGDLGLMKPDGCLYHMGRKDFQVKVRGNRVELEEVESALLRLQGIREAAVIVWEDDSGENRLIAFFVPAEEPKPGIAEIRRTLREKLPQYMVPSTFVEMPALPRTPSGKIDRNALPELSVERRDLASEYAAPRTPIEKVVARIWSQVLNIDEVGVLDHFAELGGNSLLATQVISRVIQEFQVELRLMSLL